MSKYHFKEGEPVVHKDNITHKMVVSRILKESIELIKGFDQAKNEPIKKRAVRMIGIECHWWVTNTISKQQELQKEKFHSTELVPLVEAEKGEDNVKSWVAEQSK